MSSFTASPGLESLAVLILQGGQHLLPGVSSLKQRLQNLGLLTLSLHARNPPGII